MASINPIVKLIVRNVYGGDVGASHVQALENYSHAIALCPRRLTHHAELGKTYLKLGRKQEALEALEAALECGPLPLAPSHEPAHALPPPMPSFHVSPHPSFLLLRPGHPLTIAEFSTSGSLPRRCEVEDINAQNGKVHAAIIRSELVRVMRVQGRVTARDAAREAKNAAREARR